MRSYLYFLCAAAVGVFFVPVCAFAATSMSIGSSGSAVTTLQQELIAQGYMTGSATGYFGSVTQAAVEKFQCAQNIICSGASVSGYGIAGPKTQAALASAYAITQESVLTGVETPKATGAFETSGWLPWYDAASSTADVSPHLDDFTSVMPFGYSVDSNGNLEDTLNISQAPWPAFIAQAKASGVRVVPTVMWGDGAQEQTILSNATTRQALENQIVAAVNQNGFDGIDIDFEAKESDTEGYFSTFLQGLYQKMGQKWVYCTIESRMPLSDRYLPGQTVPSDATDYSNDYAAMNQYCDRVEIMAYDQGTVDKALNQNQTGPYAPVADPKWDTDLVELAAQTISRNKIILGIPTYGYEYQVTPVVATTTAVAYQYQTLWAFNPKYATDLAAKLGISGVRNSAGELSFSYHSSGNYSPTGDQTDIDPQSSFGLVPSTSYTNGTSTPTAAPFNFVDWSDATAMQQKIALAKQLGIRGVAFFSLNGGEDQNIWNILK